MKKRDFHLRMDLSEKVNIRRLHAYVRSIQPGYKPMPKFQFKTAMQSMSRVK